MLIALWMAPGIGAAHSPGAHVHGLATLDVVVDGANLDITLESPLDNLLGFEHAPKNEKQTQAVRAMARTLKQAQGVFIPTPAAHCSLVSVRLASSALEPALLGEAKAPASAADAPVEEAGHADLDADFHFTCAQPAELKGMEVGLMKAFAGLRKINAQIAGPRGQSAAVLTPAQRVVKW
jgi:hypothetical protein